MSEKEKMLSCRPYNAQDEELTKKRLNAQQILRQLNAGNPADEAGRRALLSALFAPKSEIPTLQPPFYCDYGAQIHFGKNVFINYNCTILDCARVEIGQDVLIGPGVQIYTATHPLSSQQRKDGVESAKAVKIGNNVWLGGACIILPGVWVGDNCVIGAGSVVTRNVPDNTVVAGNPAKIIRQFLSPAIAQINQDKEPPKKL